MAPAVATDAEQISELQHRLDEVVEALEEAIQLIPCGYGATIERLRTIALENK